MGGILKDRVALVTGGARGIGRSIALGLARQGARVVVNDLGCGLDGKGSDSELASEVVHEIEALGGQAIANGDDVADWEGARAMVKAAVDTFGRLDILVNNAGILRHAFLSEMTPEQFDGVVRVNLRGSFCTMRHAIDAMRVNGHGRIINLTSSVAMLGFPEQANYGAAKGGLIGLTICAATELHKYGITVNAVNVGGWSRMSAGYSATEETEANSPEHNVPIIAYLASDQASHVSGQMLGKTPTGGYSVIQKMTHAAEMEKPGGGFMDTDDVVAEFDRQLGEGLQPNGVPSVAAFAAKIMERCP